MVLRIDGDIEETGDVCLLSTLPFSPFVSIQTAACAKEQGIGRSRNMIDKSYNQGFGYEKEVVVYYTAPSGREGYDTASKHYCVVAAGLFAHYGVDCRSA